MQRFCPRTTGVNTLGGKDLELTSCQDTTRLKENLYTAHCRAKVFCRTGWFLRAYGATALSASTPSKGKAGHSGTTLALKDSAAPAVCPSVGSITYIFLEKDE